MKGHALKRAIAKPLVALGISADFITWTGLFVALYSAWLILTGRPAAAGIMLLVSGILDMLDGAVARESGKSDPYGGILDSSLDRYGDSAVLCAILLYTQDSGHPQSALLAASALIGSFSISYVRARAECVLDDCRTGFWERGERLTVLAVALALNNLAAALWLLGIGTHWTVFQRLAFARFQTTGSSPKSVPAFLKSAARNSWPYALKILTLVGLLLFWRPSY